MRRFAALLGSLALALGLVTLVPAEATVSTPTSAEKAQWSLTGWKLGRLPAQSTLCVANGAADTGYAYEYVIEKINNPNFGPNVSVQNRCDGYSIENRMTIDTYVASGTTCAKFTNTGRYYDPVQEAEIWSQNVVLWYNLSDYCVGDDTVRAHRTAMYVEYVMGLAYSYDNAYAVICATSWCYNNIKYVTSEDQRRLGYVYGAEA